MTDDSDTKAGWNKVDNHWVYVNKEGKRQTGWLKDGGKWYYFNAEGVMQNGGSKMVTNGTI